MAYNSDYLSFHDNVIEINKYYNPVDPLINF